MTFHFRGTGAAAATFNPKIASQSPRGVARGGKVYLFEQSEFFLPPNTFLTDRVAAEFQKHERKWKQDTRHISSPVDKYLHTSYARIIGLGRAAVPHILRSLKTSPNDWFYALRAITGENPVPNAAAGDLRRMTDIWLKWGEREGLI